MKTKAVLFDLDGTLLDTLDDLADSVNAAMEAVGCAALSTGQVRAIVGNGVQNLIAGALPADAQGKLGEALCAFRAHYEVNMENKTAPYGGVLEVLDRLREAGVRTAVISNKYDGAVKALCAKYFGARIDVAVGEREGVGRKPDPAGVLEAAKALGADPSASVYVGDSDVDVLTARNAGMKCLAVSWGFRPREALAGADALIDRPDQFIEALRRLGVEV